MKNLNKACAMKVCKSSAKFKVGDKHKGPCPKCNGVYKDKHCIVAIKTPDLPKNPGSDGWEEIGFNKVSIKEYEKALLGLRSLFEEAYLDPEAAPPFKDLVKMIDRILKERG